jgi:SAM-dependent methyltransferase
VTQTSALPFGVPEVLAAVHGTERVVDAGCGSGRLTVAIAARGAAVTGFDKSASALADARARAESAGVRLTLVEADLDAGLPFADHAFDAVTSRLALMVADDPVATLHELARTLTPDGRIVTVLWATVELNPWFDAPREAVRAVLGAEHGAFAGAFGRLGSPDAAAEAHRAAGFVDVESRLLQEHVVRADAAEHWTLLAAENGHFRRIDATLDDERRGSLVAELGQRLEAHRDGGRIVVPRTLVLVTARRAG